jgi:hypothetical protein
MVWAGKFRNSYAARSAVTARQARRALAEKQPVEADAVLADGSHEAVVKVSGRPDAVQPGEGGTRPRGSIPVAAFMRGSLQTVQSLFPKGGSY